MDFVAIDFETANRNRNSVCSVGVVKVKNGVIISEDYSLINPLQNFDPINIGIHGIYEQDVKNAPTFKEYWCKLSQHLAGEIIIAHNASFDISVLRASLDHARETYPRFSYSCSYIVAKKIYPGLSSYKLSVLSALLNIPLNHHHALDDARASAKIMINACERREVNSLLDLHPKIGVNLGKLFPGGYKAASGAKKLRTS